MAVFGVEKTKGYTVMSNHHLRNPDLTLKAKGLLSQILSLPENWNYTLKDLYGLTPQMAPASEPPIPNFLKRNQAKLSTPDNGIFSNMTILLPLICGGKQRGWLRLK